MQSNRIDDTIEFYKLNNEESSNTYDSLGRTKVKRFTFETYLNLFFSSTWELFEPFSCITVKGWKNRSN